MSPPKFWFEGNQWHGTVDGPAAWAELRLAYPASLILRARKAATYGEEGPPNFGLRIEHVGPETLGGWLKIHDPDMYDTLTREASPPKESP